MTILESTMQLSSTNMLISATSALQPLFKLRFSEVFSCHDRKHQKRSWRPQFSANTKTFHISGGRHKTISELHFRMLISLRMNKVGVILEVLSPLSNPCQQTAGLPNQLSDCSEKKPREMEATFSRKNFGTFKIEVSASLISHDTAPLSERAS